MKKKPTSAEVNRPRETYLTEDDIDRGTEFYEDIKDMPKWAFVDKDIFPKKFSTKDMKPWVYIFNHWKWWMEFIPYEEPKPQVDIDYIWKTMYEEYWVCWELTIDKRQYKKLFEHLTPKQECKHEWKIKWTNQCVDCWEFEQEWDKNKKIKELLQLAINLL